MPLPWTRAAPDAPPFVDTPLGLLGAGGTHFRTTEALLRDYAAPVLDAEGLGALVARAEVWVRSPQAVGGLALLVLLATLPWGLALALAAAVYVLWTLTAPAVPHAGAARLLRVLEHPVVQALLYVFVLSALAGAGRFGALWAGLGGFVALRLGLVDALARPVLAPLLARLYPLPVPDQVLRGFILRAAIRQGIALPGLDAMERRLRQTLARPRPRR